MACLWCGVVWVVCSVGGVVILDLEPATIYDGTICKTTRELLLVLHVREPIRSGVCNMYCINGTTIILPHEFNYCSRHMLNKLW